jgi:hypothetical protein
MAEVIKYKTQMCFLGYQQGEDGDLKEIEQKKVESPATDEPELSGIPKEEVLSEAGIYTGKVIAGQIHALRDEFEDLLSVERSDGWAVFAVRLNK